MRDLNKAMVIGNLTRDPESRFTTSGQAVASFTVATNRRWKSADGENKDSVEFNDIVAWGKLAEIVEQLLRKGRRVYVEGRLQTRSWEGQDGVKRNKTEIVASDVIVLDRKPDEAGLEVSGEQTEPEAAESSSLKKTQEGKEKAKPEEKKEDSKSEEEVDLDDIPF